MRFSTRLHLADRSGRSRQSPFLYDPAVEAARPQWARRKPRITITPLGSPMRSPPPHLRPSPARVAASIASTRGLASHRHVAGRSAAAKAAPASRQQPTLRARAGKVKAGLAGQALPADADAHDLEVDPGVASINQAVADDGIIEVDDDTYAAHLALVNRATNSDKYYILQLIDCNGEKFVYRRHGRTGTRGAGQLDGPLSLAEAKTLFGRLFRQKTGQNWEARDVAVKPSKHRYVYLKTSWRARGDEEPDSAAWRYHLTADPQGKPSGWYDYDGAAGAEVEELYRQWAIDGNTDMAVRCIHAPSSGFTYRVDLAKMTQTNTTSSKCRSIRRDTAV